MYAGFLLAELLLLAAPHRGADAMKTIYTQISSKTNTTMKKVRKQINDAGQFMRIYGGITEDDAMSLGIKNLSAVICRIRKMGVEVTTTRTIEVVEPKWWQRLLGQRTQHTEHVMYTYKQ